MLGQALRGETVFRGTVTGVNGTVVSSSTSWSGNPLITGHPASGGVPANQKWALHIVSGKGTGTMVDVTSATATSVTVGVNLNTVIAADSAFEVIRQQTIAGLFGPNNEAGLGADQDKIWIPTGPGTYDRFYWK